MANEEVLGPRKTMFVLVIVVGCFAVLWPRILSPLILGHTREQLKPNKFDREAAVKQERPSVRTGGPHPALRERGRAIPAGAAAPASSPIAMPPHVRVRSSPLSVYYELDIKPPPIPGMRPPLGSPGGPVPAPKSSMGFVMPIYTICIIVFFVYTLSKILFKRAGPPYESVTPDPQFRRRVFRDDSRTSPDKLVVTAISGLVAEVQQQMEASYTQNQQRQDVQDNHTRPYTNGTILHNSGPVHIVTSEYQEASKEIPELQKVREPSQESKESTPEPVKPSPELIESTLNSVESSQEQEELSQKLPELISELEQPDIKANALALEANDTPVAEEDKRIENDEEVIYAESEEKILEEPKELNALENESTTEPQESKFEQDEIANHIEDMIKLSDNLSTEKDVDVTNIIKDFLEEESKVSNDENVREKQSTPDLLEEAIKEDSQNNEEDDEQENASVKVVGMEVTAHAADGGAWPRTEPPLASPPVTQRPHEAEDVKSIFLETEIPQQSRVLIADFGDKPEPPVPTDHSPMVVSGKMTLSLIQDAPRETPERDPESTVDDFTTASAVTQPAAEKQEEEVEESDEELEEEIEIEEIEEEVEEEEEEDEEPAVPEKTEKKVE